MAVNNNDITEVLTTMGNLYSKRRTIVDDMNDLNNFKRKPNEHIHTAMQRAQIMAERVKHLWPDTVWEQTKRLEILLCILRQIISENTKKHIDFEEMKYWKNGMTIEYKALLDMVETFEHVNNEVPKATTDLIINVCTNTPKAPIQTGNNVEHVTSHIGNRKLHQLMTNVARLNQTLGIATVEPMETGYKPTMSFPPKPNQPSTPTTQNTPNSFQKKRRLDEQGTFKPVNNPTTGPRQPVKAKRPERSTATKPDNIPNIRNHPSQTQQKTPTTGPTQVSPAKDIDLRPKTNNYNNQYQGNQYQNKPYQKSYNNTYGNKSYGGYKRPYNNNYRGGYRNYRGSYNRGYNNNYYRRGYSRGYNNNGYRGNYRNNNYRGGNSNSYNYDTKTNEIRTPRDYRCPSCKNLHKISSFCPNTGKMVVNENQLSLNYEGSHQALPMRTLQRFD